MTDLSLEEVVAGLGDSAPTAKTTADMSLEDVVNQKEASEKSKALKTELTTPEKMASSVVTSASRLAGLPGDTLSMLMNLPQLAARGASWLWDSNSLREFAESITPTNVNEFLAPATAEKLIPAMHQRIGTTPYEAKSPLGAVSQAITERGPSFAAPGAALGVPRVLNLSTSIAAPAVGEIASRMGGGSDTARAIGEIGTSLIAPPTAWGLSALKKERRLRSRDPVTDISKDDPRFTRAAPYVAEEIRKSFSPGSREELLAGILNPDGANLSFSAVRPGLQSRIRSVEDAARLQKQRKESQSNQAYTQTEMTERANQMSRELDAQKAADQAATLERKLRTGVRQPEEIGAALQGEIVGAREGMEKVVKPGYEGAWQNVQMPISGRKGMADAITDTLEQAAARKDVEITPTDFLSKQLSKIVGTENVNMGDGITIAQKYFQSMPAEVAVQMRRAIDDAVGQYRTQLGDTAGGMRKEALSNLRKSINNALDDAAKTSPELAALRQADRDYAEFIAPLQEGLTGKIIQPGDKLSATSKGFKTTPESSAEVLIPKGTEGVNGARNLFKAFESQQKAGVQSNLTDIVDEHIRRLIVSKTKKGDVVGGVDKVLSDYGPFIREFDSRFGTKYATNLEKYIPQQTAAQTLAKNTQESATQGQANLERILERAKQTQRQSDETAEAIRASRSKAAGEGVTGQMVESEAPGNMFRNIMRDPERMSDALSLVRSAQKTGHGNDAYEGVLNAFRAEMQDALTGGPGFGGANRSQQIMGNYERVLRATGAPDQMITNLRSLLGDVERLRLTGGVLTDNALDTTRMNKQILYGSFGRQGGLIEAAMRTMMGGEDVGLAIAQRAMRDPEIARHIFNYRGSNPSHFLHYLVRNPTIATIVNQGAKETQIRGKNESE